MKKMGFGFDSRRAWAHVVVLALLAMQPAVSSAAPWESLRDETKQEIDGKNWGGATQIGGEALELHNALSLRIKTVNAALAEFAKQENFKTAGGAATAQMLYNELLTPFCKGLKTKFEVPANADAAQRRGYDGAKALVDMAARIDNSRKAVMNLVDCIVVYKFIETKCRWERAIATLEEWKYTEELRKIDSAFGKYCDYLEQMEKNRAVDVKGTELLMLSGLTEYTTSLGMANGWITAEMRVLDKYLAVLKDSSRQNFAEMTDAVRECSKAALAACESDFDACQESVQGIMPVDRKLFDDYFANCSKVLECVDNMLVKRSDTLRSRIVGTSSEIGRLRNLSGFSPYGAFEIGGKPVENGCPNYLERVRRITVDVKVRYQKVKKRLNCPNHYWE